VTKPTLPFDDRHAPLYTVGQVAEMLSVQPAYLRRLDSEEVVQPTRSAGGQRRYSQDQIRTVEKAAKLASEGMTLAGIRRILVLEAEVRDLQRQLAERNGEPRDC
jgi:MerR family transcriptional regulator, heat shock protein HspR